MIPQRHFTYGLVFSVLILIIFDSVGIFEALIIWISSWFIIDLDHAIFYVFKTRDFNPKRFLIWSIIVGNERDKLDRGVRERYKLPVFIFHGIEMLIVIGLLSFYNILFFWVFIGFSFHLYFDYIDIGIKRENMIMKLSTIGVLIFNWNRIDFLKERGFLRPKTLEKYKKG